MWSKTLYGDPETGSHLDALIEALFLKVLHKVYNLTGRQSTQFPYPV